MGDVIILHDRINDINLEQNDPKIKCVARTSCSFQLKKLSKGDLGYQDFHFTHKLISKDLPLNEFNHLFVRLSFTQGLLLNYKKKKFVWQTKKFEEKLTISVIDFLLITLIGILISMIF